MAIQTINIGQQPNDGTGDNARVAFGKANDNFGELDQRTAAATAAAAAAQADAAAAQADAAAAQADAAAAQADAAAAQADAAAAQSTADAALPIYQPGSIPTEDVGDIWVAGDGPYQWDSDEQEYAKVPMGDGKPILWIDIAPSRTAIAAGYAPLDGQELPRATYPDVWAAIDAGMVPVVDDEDWLADPLLRGSYSRGDGSTTFRLPDFNGQSSGSLGAVVLRGDGALSAGAAGLIQRDALQNITGSVTSIRSNRNSFGTTSGAFFKNGIENLPPAAGSSGATSLDGIGFDASLVARTAEETRALSATVVWVVKLFGAVVNPGSADAAQLASDYAALAAQLASIETAYLPTNILGVVSQAGGVPTGALIESGSNANGWYARWADGTQICRAAVTGIDIANAVGGVYRSAGTSVTWPAEFVSSGSVSAFACDNFSANIWGGCNASAESGSIVLFYHTSITGRTGVAVATGRWF